MSDKKDQNARSGLPGHADSLKQAAAMTGLPLAGLKAAKAAGCPAFRSTRVYIAELLEWIEENPIESAEGSDLPSKELLERQRLFEQVLTLRLKRAVEEKRYVLTSDVQQDHLRIANATRTELQRIIADAPTWEGLPAAQIEKRAIALVDTICTTLHDALHPLYAT